SAMRETIPGLFPACEAGKRDVVAKIRAPIARHHLAARGESLAAFDERCIPKPPQRGCRVGGPGASGVAPPTGPRGAPNTPGILSRRALPAGRGPRGASLVSVRRQTFTTGCWRFEGE